MPLSVSLTGGQSVVIHSNPEDAGGNSVVPPSNVQWAQDTSAFGTGTPFGPQDGSYKFSAPAGGPLGTTNLEMLISQGGLPTVDATVQITVIAGTLTQFAPTADSPTTP
jgi:hypothetical protein